MLKPAWTKEEFEQQLRAKGAYYHIHHPFHKRMNAGHCSKEEIQGSERACACELQSRSPHNKSVRLH